MVFIPRTYARAAGLQSEIGKMTVVHVAHLENDYRRQVHMATMDMKKSIRELKHNRAMLKRSVKHYTSKLREYKKAKKNKYYEGLLREKACEKKLDILSTEASNTAGKSETDKDYADDKKTLLAHHSPNTESSINSAKKNEGKDALLNFELNLTTKPVSPGSSAMAEAGQTGEHICEEETQEGDEPKDGRGSVKKQSLEKTSGECQEQDTVRSHRNRRSGVVNLVNITKLQYRPNVRALFRAVDTLARIHGIKQQEPKERKISSPRKIPHEQRTSVTTRQSPDHLTLPSQYLYNMKYGYTASEDALVLTSTAHALNEDPSSDASRARKDSSSFHSSKTNAEVISQVSLPRISHTEIRSTEVLDKQERRKLSRNSVPSIPESPKRPSRSSFNAQDTNEFPTPQVKLPVLQQRVSVVRKSREEVKISRPQLYPDSYFDKKFSARDCDDVKWNTAFAKLKHVHFIDTTGL